MPIDLNICKSQLPVGRSSGGSPRSLSAFLAFLAASCAAAVATGFEKICRHRSAADEGAAVVAVAVSGSPPASSSSEESEPSDACDSASSLSMSEAAATEALSDIPVMSEVTSDAETEAAMPAASREISR